MSIGAPEVVILLIVAMGIGVTALVIAIIAMVAVRSRRPPQPLDPPRSDSPRSDSPRSDSPRSDSPRSDSPPPPTTD